MPVIHEYADGSGMYLKSNIDGSFVTLQATAAAEGFLSNLGYTDGDTVSWYLIKPLWERNHIYTGGSGTTVQASDFDADKIDSASINAREKKQLKEFLHSNTNKTETSVPDDIPQLLRNLSSKKEEQSNPATLLSNAADRKGAIKSIRHFGQHHPITANDVHLSENGHPVYTFTTADIEWTGKDQRWTDSTYDWTFTIHSEDSSSQTIRTTSKKFDWNVKDKPLTKRTLWNLLVVYPDIVWLCRETPGYSVSPHSWNFQNEIEARVTPNESLTSIINTVSRQIGFDGNSPSTQGVIVDCGSEYGRLQTLEYRVLPFSFDKVAPSTDDIEPGLPVSVTPKQHRGTHYAFDIEPIDIDSGHLLWDGLEIDTARNQSEQQSDEDKENSESTKDEDSTAKYSANADFSTDTNLEEELPDIDRTEGEITFIDNKMTYGFIEHKSLNESIYLTSREIRRSEATIGDTVSFKIEDTHGGIRAVDVSKSEEIAEFGDADQETHAQETGSEKEDPLSNTEDEMEATDETETYPDTVYNEDILRCPCCDTLVSAVELLPHIQESNDNAHGPTDGVPEDLDLDSTQVVKEGQDTVVFPPQSIEVESEDFRPLCRWCGRTFLRYGALELHTESNRDSVDEDLHSSASIKNSGVIAAFDKEDRILATEDQLEEVLTATAVQSFDSLEEKDDDHSQQLDERPKHERESREAEYGRDAGRIPELESYWLYTDLSRFLEFIDENISLSSDDEDVLKTHLESAVRERNRLDQLCADLSVSLRQYKSVWDTPKLGREISDELLQEIGITNSGDCLHLPEGYQLPFEELPDMRESTIAKREQERSNAEGRIPYALIEEVLETYRTHEENQRQASWFHAAEILQQKVENWDTNEGELG